MPVERSAEPPLVADNPEESRFEAETSAGTAVLEYSRKGQRLILEHTEVPQATRERGIGSQLVAAAFQQARERGLKVVLWCPFARAYFERHPELRDWVEERS